MFSVIFPILAAIGAVQNTQSSSLDTQIQSLQKERDLEELQAESAANDADRFLTQDWLSYRRALQRKEYLQKRVHELDAKIAELKQQKSAPEAKGK